jgi:hypothetical protein
VQKNFGVLGVIVVNNLTKDKTQHMDLIADADLVN